MMYLNVFIERSFSGQDADPVSLALCQKNSDLVFITETWLNAVNDLAPVLGSVSYQYAAVGCDCSKKGEGVILLYIVFYFIVLSAFSVNTVFQ